MKRQTFSGASDDLIELDGDLLYEEYPADDKGGAAFLIESQRGQGAVRVEVYYGTEGTWFVALAPADDGTPFPEGFECLALTDRYTTKLTLTLPDDATIIQTRGRKPDGEPL